MKSRLLSIALTLTFLDASLCYVLQLNETDSKLQIIGGEILYDEHVPYHVIIKCNGKSYCGGALVSRSHVVTAAHCVDDDCELTVVAGTNKVESGGITRHVDEKFVNGKYDESDEKFGGKHDIAVLKLRHPFPIRETIAPIKMSSRPPMNWEKITITGFGNINRYNDKESKILRRYSSILIDAEHCRDISIFGISNSDFCELSRRGVGACYGDSGGPVVNEQGKLIGVVSRQHAPEDVENACAGGKYPEVFTSVYHHRNFIKDKMDE